MMDLWHSLNGMVDVELICADPAFALTNLLDNGITVHDSVCVDALTLHLKIKRQDKRRLQLLCEKKGYELKILGGRGIYYRIGGLLRRPVLVLGFLFMLILGLYLPSRIFFIRVEGNANVPTRLILEAAAECGIRFGASREEVRSEKMKNALLESISQLQWAGINTNGCVATISVRERQETKPTENTGGVSSIVAERDGIITEFTATKGSPKCTVGQPVKAGDVLISGYTDCGITIRATRAEGEVYAKTQRQLSVITPALWAERTAVTRQEKKYSVIIGKNRINLYFDSGISDVGCVRMYEESYIILPGGFQLPILLVTETWTYYESGQTALDEETVSRRLSAMAERYLSREMTAGRIYDKNEQLDCMDDIWLLEGNYTCHEMIGRQRSEEILIPDGNSDRTDR